MPRGEQKDRWPCGRQKTWCSGSSPWAGHTTTVSVLSSMEWVSEQKGGGGGVRYFWIKVEIYILTCKNLKKKKKEKKTPENNS